MSKHRCKRNARIRKHRMLVIVHIDRLASAIVVASGHRGVRKQELREGHRFQRLTFAPGQLLADPSFERGQTIDLISENNK